jgi:osmotically inducible protein OsmC
MAVRSATAEWKGNLNDGNGKIAYGSFEGNYSFASRFEEGAGTNPEELLGAAHAGCYSMALSAALAREGYDPKRVNTTAKVHLVKKDDKMTITQIDLNVEGEVDGIDEETFKQFAEDAKNNCIVSRAINVDKMTLDAKLV